MSVRNKIMGQRMDEEGQEKGEFTRSWMNLPHSLPMMIHFDEA
jgi:hypothetical protein